MKFATCALCRNEKELKRSHVIPDSIFKRLFRGSSGKAISFKNDEDSWVRYSSDSWWDYLLCEECEKLLNDNYECYSLALLRGANGKAEKNNSGVSFSQANMSKLQLFVISIFWRAAISNISEYQKVYIPEPLRDEIRESIYLGNCITIARATVKLSRLRDCTPNGFSEANLKKWIVSPFFRQTDNRFTFCFLLEGFFVEIMTPGVRFNERHNTKGIIYPNYDGFLAPYLSVFDVPELVELLVAGFKKNVEGKVRIKPN